MTELLGHLAGRVVVVGSGLAGLVSALTLSPQPTVLLTRASLGAESSSAWAQGGIAASLGEDDDSNLHLADTLAAGDGLCDLEAAASILQDAPATISMLESFGVRFDKTPQGKFQLGLEAAHSRHRIAHVEGDGCGAAIVTALVEAVRQTPSITVLEGVEARRLLTASGRVCGLLCFTIQGAVILSTSRVVLATGGIGGLYDASTNPTGNYGQGIMLAARAGAELSDMEFVQFHPTALDCTRRPLGLISEAVRGEGAILVNEKGERFLKDQPGAELAPRDIVARAVSAEIARPDGQVFLDAREALGQGFERRFPTVAALCRAAGVDPSSERIPVRPAVHYHMGGVATDLNGRTTVEGLWVVGEAGSTGLHGANRLASNSLLEAGVMGLRAARDISGSLAGRAIAPTQVDVPSRADLSMIRPIVSRSLGVLRSADTVDGAIADLLAHVDRSGPSADPALVALSIAVFASLRQESRGAHARADFPLKLPYANRRRMTIDAILSAARSIVSDPHARSA